MRKSLTFLFALMLIVSIQWVSVSAGSYTLPGYSPEYGPYNNIGLSGLLTLDFNVTIINTAPYPKFVIINPFYDFKIYRNNGSEWMVGYYNTTTGDMSYNVSLATFSSALNYQFGFWIQPYEVVKIEFAKTELHRYYVTLDDYRTDCPGNTGLYIIEYDNGTLTGGRTYHYEDLNFPLCGVVYPRLLNYPTVIDFNRVMLSMDNYLKILKYEGIVRFKITNVPNVEEENATPKFPVLFAVSEPVIFPNAKTYDYYPNYTMTYSQYISEFIWKEKGMKPPERRELPEQTVETGLFKLTDTLISGVSVPSLKKPRPREFDFDFPIWIVLTTDGFEVSYRVSWTNSGR